MSKIPIDLKNIDKKTTDNEILRAGMIAELDAIKRVAEANPDKIFGIMFPRVISEEEMQEVFKLYRAKYQRDNIKIGAMIETPASVQIIKEICKYVKFISFGTNDLTQYTLAIDRGNSDVQYIYNEMHPAVLSQMKRVIKVCKEYKVESSICGQAGSNKEMVNYLVKQGIDSISVNADMANEISRYVLGLEGGTSTNQMENEEQIDKIDDLDSVEEKIEDKVEDVEEDKKEKEAEDQLVEDNIIVEKEEASEE